MAETKEKSGKKIGQVTAEERDEIRFLFERKNGLLELSRSLVTVDKKTLENSPLYEKIVADLGKVSTKFQDWWDEKSVGYHWESVRGSHWQIDFETCDIYLVAND